MHPDLVRRTTTTRIPTEEGTFQLSHYIDTRDGKEHLALTIGVVREQHGVLARVHSECFTGDVLGSQRCDCGEQLHEAMRRVAEAGQGIILYLRQEGRGIGLEQKLKAYNLQDQGYDTVDANLMLGHQADEREYSAAAAILRDLGIVTIRLMTNNPAKISLLSELGVRIDERLPLISTVTKDNAAYLATKIQRMRHLLTLPLYTNGHSHSHSHDHAPAFTSVDSPVERQMAKLRTQIQAHFAAHAQPFVTVSYAQTLNGTIGVAGGESLMISGPESLIVTHKLRVEHDAILIGIGTLLADNPRLTARLVEGESPQPVVVDSDLRTPLDAKIWSHPKAPWIATLNADSPKADALRARGATLIVLPADSLGRVELPALLAHLATVGVQSVMVEGGSAIIGSLLQGRLAHYAVVTIAPKLVPGIRVVDQEVAMSCFVEEPSYLQAGSDLLLWGEIHFAPAVHTFALQPKTTHDSTAATSSVSPV